MSYFRRIVERTLGSAQLSVKPAAIPEYVLENLELAAKSASVNQIRNNIWLEKKDEKQLMSAGDITKRNEFLAGPKKPSETQVDDMRSVTSKAEGSSANSTKPLANKSNDDPEMHAMERKKIATSKIAEARTDQMETESEDDMEHPVAPIRIISAQQPTEIEATAYLQPSSETHIEPIRVVADELLPSSSRQSSASNEASTTTKSSAVSEKKKYDAPQITPDTLELERLRIIMPQKNDDVAEVGAKSDHDRQQRQQREEEEDDDTHPLLTTVETNDSVSGTKTDEPMVTINIGRIEVRTDSSTASAQIPRHKFTPTLTLADYLKQRSEGRIG
jgi:hypothetical protein